MNSKIVACYNLDEKVRMDSSSGGFYSLLAEKILNEGGVVYAACYDENLEVVHRRIENISELPKSRGSKYVASKLGDTFKEIKECLQDKRKVLFVGTPCQCAGLLSIVKAGREYLTCVDFVCHGVPGRTAWREYLKALAKRGINPISINMRDKSTGWSKYQYSWNIIDKNGKEIHQRQIDNIYMKGFVKDIYLRPSCIECHFKGIERETDFTLGDYWGCWEVQPEMDDNKGTSLVMIHTENGMAQFETIKEFIRYEMVTEENAVKHNASILSVSSIYSHSKKKKFYKQIESGKDFIEIVEKLIKVSKIEKAKEKCRRILRKLFVWRKQQ